MKKFNQMDDFEITEVSSVDMPAQQPARAVIMKNTADMAAPEVLPQLAGKTQDSTGEIPMTKTAEEIAADAAVAKRIETLEGDLAKATALAGLSDVQKAHYGTLSPDAQSEFLGASSEVRDSAISKAAGEDPVVYTTLDGDDIRKSAGEFLIKMAKRADESEKNLAIEKAAREREGFAKRASSELSNLPGDESAKVALLKAVSSISGDKDRNAVSEILKAANTGISKAFETAGTSSSDGSVADAESKLEKMAQDHFSANGGSFQKSYRSVLQTPEGRELFKATR